MSAERGYVLREADLPPLSIGAALLGTGGGGNPYIGIVVFIVIPIIFIAGLVLIALGVILARKRVAAGLQAAPR